MLLLFQQSGDCPSVVGKDVNIVQKPRTQASSLTNTDKPYESDRGTNKEHLLFCDYDKNNPSKRKYPLIEDITEESKTNEKEHTLHDCDEANNTKKTKISL